MKLSTIGAATVLGSTLAGTLLISPVHRQPVAPEMESASLPITGPAAGLLRIKHGSETALTGYGVYYPVILAIARSHGLPNSYGGQGMSARTVYSELAAGHPVEVWIEARWSRPRMGTWTAWDGRRVRYSLAEHAVTLSGVSATSVRVNDPQFGSQYGVSKATFESVWRDFNNSAVIFR